MPFPRQTMHEGQVLQLSVMEPNVPTLEHLRSLTGKINIRRSMINKDLSLTLIMLLTKFNDGLTKLNICPALMGPSIAPISKRCSDNLLCN